MQSLRPKTLHHEKVTKSFLRLQSVRPETLRLEDQGQGEEGGGVQVQSVYYELCLFLQSSLICRFCPPGKCIKKKSPGEPSACKVCAPKPCILKKSVDPQENLKKSTSECKVCAPHPCVLVSEGKPLKSPKLVVKSKSAASSGDCRLCAPDPCVLKKKKKKEETCTHCQHLHPCAFN